jgi:hypothetical protein
MTYEILYYHKPLNKVQDLYFGRRSWGIERISGNWIIERRRSRYAYLYNERNGRIVVVFFPWNVNGVHRNVRLKKKRL